MRYDFEKYCFDRDTLTLYHNGQPQALKINEAKLLAFFIENKIEILSKEQILTEIWGEQNVSEQVVFQNISQLRALFGRQAIKTFPKQGYQWQLPFEAQKALPSKENTVKTTSFKESHHYSYLAVSLLLITVLVALFWLSPKEQRTNNQFTGEVYFIPFSSIDKNGQEQLHNFNNLMAQYSISYDDEGSLSSIKTLQLFNYPEITRQVSNLTDNSIIVSGYLSFYDDQLLVEYKLIGLKRSWSGYLIGENVESLTASLKSIVDSLKSTAYLSEQNSALLSAKLRLLLAQQPNEQSVIYHLLQRELNEQDYDVAKALVEKLIALNTKTPTSPYLALGLLIKGSIYHQQQDFEQALQYYNRSLAQLMDGKFSEIRYKIEIALAWLAFAQQDAEKMQRHISSAALYAQQKSDVLAQVSAYTTGSILSHKLGDMVNRYKYLNTAKSLLLTHQVAEEHFAIIYYHLALFASDKTEAESYYLKVLSLPKLTKNQWLYESATEDLLSWYIDQQEWQQALSLFQSQEVNSFNLNQRAKLLLAMQDNVAAFNIAKQAYDQARLNYQHNNALHAALLLYQLQKQSSEMGTRDYQHYISQNASKFWLDKHRDELIKLGYFEGLSN